MTGIIDLTLPIEPHFRWQLDRELKADFAKGDQFQVTYAGWVVHGFTHVDAPRHIVADGWTTSEMRLEQLIGAAAVVDLTSVAADTVIEPDDLQEAGSHIRDGDIVLLMTGWDGRVSHHTPEFWTASPYLSRAACEWLRQRGPKAVGVDFPQDYPIRGLLGGETAPITDFVSHDVLLRDGVILIEYLCNLTAIGQPRCDVAVLPLKIPDADGAPARAVAMT